MDIRNHIDTILKQSADKGETTAVGYATAAGHLEGLLSLVQICVNVYDGPELKKRILEIFEES